MFGVILAFWAALHLSQSLMDLADFLMVATAFGLAYRKQDWRSLWTSFRPPYLWPAWILVVVAGYVFGAPIELQTAARYVWEFRWILSFLCFIYLFKNLTWTERHFRSMTLVLFVISLIDIVLFFVHYSKDPRAGGMFGHSMPFAHSMGPSALLLLFVGMKKAWKASESLLWRGIYFLTPVLSSALVVLSFTRGVWLGFATALLVCLAFLGKKVFFISTGALVLVASLLFAGSERIQSRVMGKTNAESQSNNERLLYWKSNFEIFKDYPWVGIGYSQNNVYVEEYLRKDGVEWLKGAHAHNQYIHFLSGTGILGLICFLSFLGFLFRPVLFQLKRWTAQKEFSDSYFLLMGAFAGMLSFVIGALTESNFSIAKNRAVFLFISAIAYALSSQWIRSQKTEK